jgi:hypothetical protein
MEENKIIYLPYHHDDVAEYLKKVKKKKKTAKGKISKRFNNFYSK